MKATTNTIESARAKLNAKYLTSYEYPIVRENGRYKSIQVPVYKTGKQIIADRVKDAIQGFVFGVENLASLIVAGVKIVLVMAAICSPWIFEYLISLI